MKSILSYLSFKTREILWTIREIPNLILEMSALLRECNYSPYNIRATRELWQGVFGFEPPRDCDYHKRPVKECWEKHCTCRLTYGPLICEGCGTVLEEHGDRCRCDDEQDLLDCYGEDEEDEYGPFDEDPGEDPRFDDGRCSRCGTFPEEVPYEGGHTIWICACDR